MYVNPKILKMFEQNQNSTLAYLSKMLKWLGLIFILLTLVSFFIPIQIYEILLEPKIIRDNYYFYTFILLLIGIFTTVYQTAFSMYLNLFKKLNILSYIYLIAFIVNVIGNFFIKDYGIIAAGISTLVAYIVILLLQILYVSKYIKMEINNV
jgi:O-antigen/teichoic acid export membrane protein